MSNLPTLGRSRFRRRRRFGRLFAVLIVVGAGLAIWRWVITDDPETSPSLSPPLPTAASPAEPAVAPPAPAEAPPTGNAVDDLRALGMQHVKVAISGPLETAFVTALGRDVGPPLTQVVTRTLVWWVSIPGDLRPGDLVEVLFSERSGAEPLVHAVRFRSEKAGKTFEAYRFQEPGASVAHLYTRDGNEVELRLQEAPLDDYEQVTSLLRDGRGHKGVDFRTPVGTPVKATFDSVVVRRNWNFRANGNCLELRERGGAQHIVYLLHLSELSSEPRVGDRVAKGQVVAKSGNTGRSFAPHLHYQLMSRSGRVLDPFAAQPTLRRALRADHRAAFDSEVTRLAGFLDRAAAGR